MSTSPPNYHQLNSEHKALLKSTGLLFANEKSSVQLLTLKRDAEAVFKLTDDDWANICGLDVRYRPAVEEALRDYWHEFVKLWDES